MKLKSKREFTAKARKAIHKRDNETCVFCAIGYYLPDQPAMTRELQIMHIVPRSQNGMGVEQNGALGCIWHHIMLDNGNQGRRGEMTQILEDRMRSLYPGWTRESVTYHKHPDYKKAAAPPEETGGSRAEHNAAASQGAENTPPAAGFISVEGVSGEIPI